ncbi:class I SAM-dependent DNA methyltransferase [Alloyangia pacifica]|uniref:class I SAM-dependent DNA methyltransferase n=1 Tax=Alloyangia pacifica TaxID=311180 RepID=UPI001CD1E1DE|nr:methyltransferase [Alloyangia pacifica]MCA0997058.1 methyltransferase [Alloyangia pacifica]
MLGTAFPCGDPVAERRAGFAETLAHLGDMAGAIEVLMGVMQIVPDWAAGWFRLGEWLEGCGAVDAAAEAWDKAVVADPRDPLGAGLRRDLLRGVPVAETMPPAFVELLFDQYAPRFDRSLVGRLEYRGPDLLITALRGQGLVRAERALDLGCGTGLMGAVLRDRCGWLVGYDISAGMLAEAAVKGDYDLLEKRDIALLDLDGTAHDLIVAADVFIYLGALERMIGWCAGALAPGGYLAFTVELGDAPVQLRESRRFAHSRSYVEQLLAQAGFVGVAFEDCVLRQDRGADVAALVVTARAPVLVQDWEGDAAEALA